MPPLEKERHERFCLEFVKDLNASAAYVRAGYKSKTPNERAAKLTANDSISARIKELNSSLKLSTIASAQERREALTLMIRGVEHNVPGKMGGSELLPPSIGERIKAIEVLSRLERDGAEPISTSSSSLERIALDLAAARVARRDE